VKFNKEQHVPQPPKNWMARLKAFAETIIPSNPEQQGNGGNLQ
jgi:hypothetical protein